MSYTEEDITIVDNTVYVRGVGRVGYWWSKYDKRVTISYLFEESFTAETEEEIKKTILKYLNGDK